MCRGTVDEPRGRLARSGTGPELKRYTHRVLNPGILARSYGSAGIDAGVSYRQGFEDGHRWLTVFQDLGRRDVHERIGTVDVKYLRGLKEGMANVDGKARLVLN